ncbi:MAG: permease [Aggregatilineaceae bacterium]
MAATLNEFGQHFLAVLWHTVPWVLLGSFVSGVLAVFLDPADLSRRFPQRAWLAAGTGALLGLALPLGEYAVLPVVRRLLGKGLPLAAGIALLLAGPVITPIALAASYSALPPSVVLRHALVMALAGTGAGIVAAWLAGRTSPLQSARSDFVPGEPLYHAWRRAFLLGLRDFLTLSPWLVLGALLAAGMRTAVAPHDLETLATGRAGEVLSLAARGTLLPGDTLHDVSLAHNLAGTYSGRAVLALLVFGSTDLMGMVLWLRILRRRAALLSLILAWLIAVPLLVALPEERPLQSPARAVMPGVLFLGPADAYARNLYLARPDTGAVVALTDSPRSIEDFAPAPDGTQVAFTQNNDDGTADLWLLDVATGATRRLTHCVRARCSSPAWHPDGTQIAYQRQDFSAISESATRTTRAWVVDVSTAQSRLLFDDPQQLGADPLWSPDGQRIAIYDAAGGGIRVRDQQTGEEMFLVSEPGDTGAFAPDGTRLVYPFLVRGALGQEFYTHLALADLSAESQVSLSGEPDAPVEDAYAAWSPDGTRLAVARRYLDERYTPGKQIYLLDVATGAATPLIVDAAYTHAAPQWDSSGRWIAYQRFALDSPDAQPEIWIFDTQTGQARLLAENMFFPAWLPPRASQ